MLEFRIFLLGYSNPIKCSHFDIYEDICNSYTMGCPPVRVDNPRALASGLSNVQVDNPWYNYFIPPTLM